LASTRRATVDYQYDAAGRLVARTVDDTAQETFGYDALDRVVVHTDPLGQFNISYLGQTPQKTGRQIAGTSNQTAWSYLPNSGDRRLAAIDNFSIRKYQFTTMPETLVSAITQQSASGSQTWNFGYDDANRLTAATSTSALHYDITLDPAGNIRSALTAGGTLNWSYNELNELVSGSTGSFTYDADGNRLTDGSARNYTWDAENRLTSVTSGSQPISQFAYDALGRRIAITTTPSVGAPVATAFVWCGSQICQSRSSPQNSVLRQYYDEGEYIPSTGTRLYYGRDQLGSVRDVSAVSPQGTTVQAYDYDPFGNALQAPPAGPTPNFGYAGMYYDAGTGLYLTQYRAYDPATARWLSRDPVGEQAELGPQSGSPNTPNPALTAAPPLPPPDTFTPTRVTLPGQAASAPAVPPLVLYDRAATDRSNLYLYGSADPVNRIDPLGLDPVGDLGGGINIFGGIRDCASGTPPGVVLGVLKITLGILQIAPDIIAGLKEIQGGIISGFQGSGLPAPRPGFAP
jgi:RHS repeat-associated protein